MVSKPPQGDKRCGEIQERTVHRCEPLVTNQQSSEPTKPGERPLNDPAMSIASQLSTVLESADGAVVPIRHDDGDPASREAFAKGVTVIRPVGDQPFRVPIPAAASDTNGAQRRVDERDLRWGGRADMYSQRNTLAVDHHHALRTLSTLGFADVGAPFFADANEPSMNTCSHRMRPRASSCSRNARHIANHVPSTSHCRNRRQQVDPLGYPSGRSRHRAPVFRTHRIPSTTSRWLTRGRPPLRERRLRGRCGSILAHCASVSRTVRLPTLTSDQRSTATRKKVQALIDPFNGF